jgi:membrane protease YdiL (CAAX protease family)
VLPAVCEEPVFRGALLHPLGSAAGIDRTVLLSARVVWRTRSIYTGMVMHVVNNAAVVLLVSTPALRDLFPDPSAPPAWLLAGLAPFVLWVGLRLITRRPDTPVAGLDAPEPTETAPLRSRTEVGSAGST